MIRDPRIIRIAAETAIIRDRDRAARRIGNVVISGRGATEIVETGFKLLNAIESMTVDWLRVEGLRLAAAGAKGSGDDLAG